MSVQDIFEQLGSEFKELSTYDRVVKAKQEFPDLTNKQLAEDVVGCPAQKFRKHLAKARKQGHLPESNEQIHSTDSKILSETSEYTLQTKSFEKSSNNKMEKMFVNSFEENAYSSNVSQSCTVTNQYKLGPKERNFADKAHGLSIGDKVIVCNVAGLKSHAICECFDIKSDKWRVRSQSSFQASLVSMDNIQVFETHYQKCAPIILSESGSSGLVLSVERITEYKNGTKLVEPLYEVMKRPSRHNTMPLLYPEKPTWTVEEAKRLMCKCGMNIGFMFDMFMTQREADAKWKDFIYVGKVLECNILKSEKEKKESRKSLKEWNLALQTAGYQEVRIHRPHTSHSELNFPEFMEAYGYPSIDKSRRKKSLIGLSFDFIPQVCDYCDHHATSLPVCECGESFCNPACRLAEWDDHKSICEQALDEMTIVNMIDKLWLSTKGYKSDCEGRAIKMK